MARANRYFLPGYVWHITQRCHRKSFLLKFARDRRRWCHWLFEAKKRYGLRVLNYIVTRNHIHLLVLDAGRGEIPSSMQLVAGRVAQEFNTRKGRCGAFWEDRYHATVVESDSHLLNCVVYIDLNMVRAGVVSHPSVWMESGYREIQAAPQRYRIIDTEVLVDLLGVRNQCELAAVCRDKVERTLDNDECTRDPRWTESVAVGSQLFVADVRRRLGPSSHGPIVVESEEMSVLREPWSTYRGDPLDEKGPLSEESPEFDS